MNHSFTITDGALSCHLKLAELDKCRDALRRWATLHELLEQRHHAPRMLRWISVPDTGCEGMLFEHIDGRCPDFGTNPGRLAAVIATVCQLHQDTDLATRLRVSVSRGSCADFFTGIYIRRFDEDLDVIEPDCPEFIKPETLTWMRDETRRLESLVHTKPAFAAPAEAPVHADLWTNNILATSDGRWYIVDWDGHHAR